MPNTFPQQSQIKEPNIDNFKASYIQRLAHLVPSNPGNFSPLGTPTPQKVLCRVTIFFTTVEGILNRDKKNNGIDEKTNLIKQILPSIEINLPFQVLNLDLIMSTTRPKMRSSETPDR